MARYIHAGYCVTANQLDNLLANVNYGQVNVDLILMIDYVYHHDDNDYDGGLSFLDRLYNKLNKFFELNWDVDGMKANIRTSNDPQSEFMMVLRDLLANKEFVTIYGV